MGNEWQKCILGDIVSIKHGYAFKGKYFTTVPTETILVTPGNFAIGGGFQKKSLKYYHGPVPVDYVLRPGQLVVTMTDLSKESDTLGYSALIPDDENTWLHNQRIGLVEIKEPGLADTKFINYLLRTRGYRSWVVGSASGTTVKHTSPDRICAYSFLLPSLSEQEAIACILGALEDKIELNRQMCRTLEETAQAIFKSWFVDFDPVHAKASGKQPEGMKPEIAALFPDSFVDSELGKLPKGWRVSTCLQYMNIISGGTPKTTKPEYWDGVIPWYSIGDAPLEHEVFVLRTVKNISQAGLENSSAKILPVGTTIISARGTVGKLALTGVPMAMNQSCYGLASNSGTPFWNYLTISRAVVTLKQRTHGSVFDTVTRDTLKALNIIDPGNKLIQAFEKAVGPLMRVILNNLIESHTLELIRDILLPRLISGDLRIIESEKILKRIV